MLGNSLNKGFRGSLVTISVLYLLLFTLSVFVKNSSENYYYPNIFYNYLTSQIHSEFLIFILNHGLLIGGISLIAYIVSNEEIVDKLNYFPVFIFLLINAMVLGKDRVSLFLVGNIAILYSVYKIFNTYRQEKVLSSIYNACFWISVTLYLNIANIFIFPFIFISLVVLRPFNWREYAIAIIGFISPIFIYECLSYLFNFNQWYVLEGIVELLSSLRSPLLNIDFLPFLIFTIFLFALSALSFLVDGFGNTVKKQKSKTCFFWYMILISPSIFVSGVNYEKILVLYSIPLCFFIGDFLFNIKRVRLTNLLLVLFIFSALFYFVKKTALI